MSDDSPFELLDAAGVGACEVDAEGSVRRCSPGMSALLGKELAEGAAIHDLLSGLGPLDGLPRTICDLTVRVIGSDEIARDLAVAARPGAEGTWLVVVDRTAQAKAERDKAALTRQVTELQEDVEIRRRAPRKNRVRPRREVIARLEESMARAKRYRHELSVLAVRLGGDALDEKGRAKLLLMCVRGVDDLGAAGSDSEPYTVVLPHTPMAGGKIVAERIVARAKAAGLSAAVGVARAGEENAETLAGRAASACRQASTDAVLVAVEVV